MTTVLLFLIGEEFKFWCYDCNIQAAGHFHRSTIRWSFVIKTTQDMKSKILDEKIAELCNINLTYWILNTTFQNYESSILSDILIMVPQKSFLSDQNSIIYVIILLIKLVVPWRVRRGFVTFCRPCFSLAKYLFLFFCEQLMFLLKKTDFQGQVAPMIYLTLGVHLNFLG